MSEEIINGHSEREEPEKIQISEIPLATQKEIIETDYIRKSLDHVASLEGFKNYELIFDYGSKIGDGFMGIILKVKITEIGSDKNLEVLAKIPPQNEARKNMPGTMPAFEREVFLYNDLLPEFVAFQKEKRIKPTDGFFNFPKVYYADYDAELKDGIIIMEDLRDRGFRMWDKYTPINLEHSKLAMKALGRLHALSFAMKKKKPETFKKFQNLQDLFTIFAKDENTKGFLEQSMKRCYETLDPNDTRSREKFKKIADNFADVMSFCFSGDAAEPYAIMNHGDCWMNNFLYHYNSRGSVEEIVLIDWQISRYCSPVIDLMYFIFICTDKHMRDNHFDELIQIYHRSLKELLDHLGGDTMTQFPFTALLRQLKKLGKIGILSGCFAVPMMQTKNENLLDMDVMAEKMKNMSQEELEEVTKQFLEMNKDNVDKINIRIRDIILDGIRFGYF